MINKILLATIVLIAAVLFPRGPLFSAPIKDPNPVVRTGDLLPNVSFSNTVSSDGRKYLGIGDGKLFLFQEIKSDLLIIKYLNTNCVYCIKLLPTFLEIYQAIEADRNLKTKVKILGIGAGDTPVELEALKEKHPIPYPVIPDTDFKAHQTVGGPRVPFIIVARKDNQGHWVVASVNVGMIFSADHFVGEIRAILAIDPETLKLKKSP